MNARWRVPLALSAAVLLAQIAPTDPLVDVVRGGAPHGVRLAWPIFHVVFAPFTLLADWLNGGSRADLKGFAVWVLVGYAVARLWTHGRTDAGTHGRTDARTHRMRGEAVRAAAFLLAFCLFVWWGARWNRPIPRLVAADSSLIVFDIHSHTSASHDGRPGFGAAANARWHARAGFDAAFVTDHNVFGAAKQWQKGRGSRPPRLLDGEELSLSGLHIVVLGNDSLIRNTPWSASFDSSLALLSAVSRQPPAASREPPAVGREPSAVSRQPSAVSRQPSAASRQPSAVNHQPSAVSRQPPAVSRQPFLIASLPEYWEHHWGRDLGRLVSAGVGGFEVWTTSPRAMDFPPAARRTLIARSLGEHLALFGATDMHGLGNTAGVWNVARLPGWRRLDEEALTRALVALFRDAPDSVHVVAVRRWRAESRVGNAFAAPAGVVTALRAASRAHAVALVAWIWTAALVVGRRRAAR